MCAAHAGHVQRVGDDDAVETQLAAQQVDEQPPVERGRLGAEGREHDVRGHDQVDARIDGGREGCQLAAADHGGVGVDDREARCESAVVAPWPGKCLAHAATPVERRPRTQAAPCRPTRSRVGAERADADDRVAGVAVHVDRRREVDVDPRAAQVGTDGRRDLGGERLVVDRAESEVPG